MAQRTVLYYIYDVQRELNGQGNTAEIFQAIHEAIKKINAKAAWEFQLATHMLTFQKLRREGTLAGTYGSPIITGTNTHFDVTQPGYYWTLQLGNRRLPYMVKSFDLETQLTLVDPVGSVTNEVGPPITFSNISYSLWRDRFPLPADCPPGRDIGMKGPFGTGADGGGDIKKKVRMTHERRRNEFRLAGPPIWYTDDGLDPILNVPTIRMYPPPVADMEVRLLYYKRMSLPVDQSSVISVPEDFERLIVTLAAALVAKRKGMKGWLAIAQEASDTMNDMYSLYAASAGYVDEIEADDGGASSNREPVGLGGDLYTF